MGGSQASQPIPSKVRFLSNKGSGRPGWPHWGVRFLFCTRNLSWWGRPRGGCRAGLFSETRERRRKGTKGWGRRAGPGRESSENRAAPRRSAGGAGRGQRDTHARRPCPAQPGHGQAAGGRRRSDRGLWEEACGREKAQGVGRREMQSLGQRGAVLGKGPHPELGSLLLVLLLECVADRHELTPKPTGSLTHAVVLTRQHRQTHTLACAHMPAPHTQAPHAYTSAISSLWTRAHRDRCCSLPHSLPMYVGSVHRYKHTGIAALSALHTVQTETHVDAETRAHQQTCGLRSAHVCSCFRLGGSAHALAHECKA